MAFRYDESGAFKEGVEEGYIESGTPFVVVKLFDPTIPFASFVVYVYGPEGVVVED